MTKIVSLKTVAHEAGVSIATASRVLGKSSHPVNSETAAKVLKVAERLGYSPNALARAIVTQHSGLIGVLVGDNSDPYFATITHGIHTVAHQHGSLVMVCNTLRDPQIELDYLAILDSYHAEGILLVGGVLTYPDHEEKMDAIIERYLKNGGYVVTLTDHRSCSATVTVDNYQASFDMAIFLTHMGHRRIGYVRGPANLSTSEKRERGFLDAMQAAAIPQRSISVVDGGFSVDIGMQAMHELMSQPRPPTAVFTANDLNAIGCLITALNLGLKVPEDVSIAGMDNIEPARYIIPPLTTVDIPMLELGKQAAARLFALIEGKPVPPITVLRHELVIRGSTAPPNQPPLPKYERK